jgi:hypothetical protein
MRAPESSDEVDNDCLSSSTRVVLNSDERRLVLFDVLMLAT